MFRKWSGLSSKKPFMVNNRYSSAPKKIFFWSFFIIVIALVIVGFNFINPNWSEFFSSFGGLWLRIKQLLSWNFADFTSIPYPIIQPHSFMYESLMSVLDTFVMAFVGTVIGTFMALPMAIFASKNIFHNKVINGVLKTILSIFRTIPAFVFSLIFVGIFGPNNLTVTIAIIIFTFAMTSKMMYDRIEQVDMGPYEVVSATGANKFASFKAAIFPQVMKHIVSTWWYALEVNIRYIAIFGLVVKVGIGAMIDNKVSAGNWPQAGWLLFLLIMTIITIEMAAFITKKWIMNDKDKILDNKQVKKFTRKTLLLNKLPNYWYWKTQIILLPWKLEKQKLKTKIKSQSNAFEKVNLINQLRQLNRKRKIILKNAIKNKKNNIKHDKALLIAAKKSKNKTFVFDEVLLQKIRLDKISKSHYQMLIANTKLTNLNQKQELANNYHQIFKSNLTSSLVYKSRPLSNMKRIIFRLVVFSAFIYTCSKIKFGLASNGQISDTWQHIKDMFNISWDSLFSITDNTTYPAFYLIFETIMIAVVGTFLGFIFALILGMLSSSKVTNKYVARVFWLIATVIRPIPSYIYAIFLVSLVGLGPFTGALSLAIATTGMLSKYIRESFNDIDTTILETLTASGANYFQRFRYGILPQVAANIVSWGIYRFSINITESAILGVVSAGNFGFVLNGYFNAGYYHEFGALLFAMIFTNVMLELLINVLRNKIKNGLDPYSIYKLKKTFKRLQSPWYVINGRLLKKPTASMEFDELKALFKYTNVTIFRNSFKQWIKTCYKLWHKKPINWKQAYANSYCQYFNLDSTNSIDNYKHHNQQFLLKVKQLINSRRKYLKKTYQTKKIKIKSLKHEYQMALLKIKTDYQIIASKLATNNITKSNYKLAIIKHRNELKVLKTDYKNNIIIAKSLWKSVKLRHE